MSRLRYVCCNGWECDCRGEMVTDDIDDDFAEPHEPTDYDFDRGADQYERHLDRIGEGRSW